MKIFKDHLRAIRKSKGSTQKQVAQAINVTERNYQLYESGDQKPSFDVLIALADYFNVSLDYLMGRSDILVKHKDGSIVIVESMSPPDK